MVEGSSTTTGDQSPSLLETMRGMGVEPIDLIGAYLRADVKYRNIRGLNEFYKELIAVWDEEQAIKALARFKDE